jgi:hypothetical protein
MRPGNQIHTSSFLNTDQPHGVKKDLILIGETWIGVQGRKYRLEEKGDKNATPLPPFVMASRRPWLVQTAKKRTKYQNQRPEKSASSRKKRIINKRLMTRPKNGE